MNQPSVGNKNNSTLYSRSCSTTTSADKDPSIRNPIQKLSELPTSSSPSATESIGGAAVKVSSPEKRSLPEDHSTFLTGIFVFIFYSQFHFMFNAET